MKITSYHIDVQDRPKHQAKATAHATAEAMGAGSAQSMRDAGNALMSASNNIVGYAKDQKREQERLQKEQERKAKAAAKEARSQAEKAANQADQVQYYDMLNNWRASKLNIGNMDDEEREQLFGQVEAEITGSGYTSSTGEGPDKWTVRYNASAKNINEFVNSSGINSETKRAQLRSNLLQMEMADIEQGKKKEQDELLAQEKRDITQRRETAQANVFAAKDDAKTLDMRIETLRRTAIDEAEAQGFVRGTEEHASAARELMSPAILKTAKEYYDEGKTLQAEAFLNKYAISIVPGDDENIRDDIAADKTATYLMSKNIPLSEAENQGIVNNDNRDIITKAYERKSKALLENKEFRKDYAYKFALENGYAPKKYVDAKGVTQSYPADEYNAIADQVAKATKNRETQENATKARQIMELPLNQLMEIDLDSEEMKSNKFTIEQETQISNAKKAAKAAYDKNLEDMHEWLAKEESKGGASEEVKKALSKIEDPALKEQAISKAFELSAKDDGKATHQEMIQNINQLTISKAIRMKANYSNVVRNVKMDYYEMNRGYNGALKKVPVSQEIYDYASKAAPDTLKMMEVSNNPTRDEWENSLSDKTSLEANELIASGNAREDITELSDKDKAVIAATKGAPNISEFKYDNKIGLMVADMGDRWAIYNGKRLGFAKKKGKN